MVCDVTLLTTARLCPNRREYAVDARNTPEKHKYWMKMQFLLITASPSERAPLNYEARGPRSGVVHGIPARRGPRQPVMRGTPRLPLESRQQRGAFMAHKARLFNLICGELSNVKTDRGSVCSRRHTDCRTDCALAGRGSAATFFRVRLHACSRSPASRWLSMAR
jgi:hypothetical protein